MANLKPPWWEKELREDDPRPRTRREPVVVEEIKTHESQNAIAVIGFDAANAGRTAAPLFTMKPRKGGGVQPPLVAKVGVAAQDADEGADAENHVHDHLLPGRLPRLPRGRRKESPFANFT